MYFMILLGETVVIKGFICYCVDTVGKFTQLIVNLHLNKSMNSPTLMLTLLSMFFSGELDAWLSGCALESKQYKIFVQTTLRGCSLMTGAIVL